MRARDPRVALSVGARKSPKSWLERSVAVPTSTRRRPGASGSAPRAAQAKHLAARRRAPARQAARSSAGRARRARRRRARRDEVAGDGALAEEDDEPSGRAARALRADARASSSSAGYASPSPDRDAEPDGANRAIEPAGCARPPARWLRSCAIVVPARTPTSTASAIAIPSAASSAPRRPAPDSPPGEPDDVERRAHRPARRRRYAAVFVRFPQIVIEHQFDDTVARLVVEDPPAALLAARLETPPRAGSLRRGDDGRGERRERRALPPEPAAVVTRRPAASTSRRSSSPDSAAPSLARSSAPGGSPSVFASASARTHRPELARDDELRVPARSRSVSSSARERNHAASGRASRCRRAPTPGSPCSRSPVRGRAEAARARGRPAGRVSLTRTERNTVSIPRCRLVSHQRALFGGRYFRLHAVDGPAGCLPRVVRRARPERRSRSPRSADCGRPPSRAGRARGGSGRPAPPRRGRGARRS